MSSDSEDNRHSNSEEEENYLTKLQNLAEKNDPFDMAVYATALYGAGSVDEALYWLDQIILNKDSSRQQVADAFYHKALILFEEFDDPELAEQAMMKAAEFEHDEALLFYAKIAIANRDILDGCRYLYQSARQGNLEAQGCFTALYFDLQDQILIKQIPVSVNIASSSTIEPLSYSWFKMNCNSWHLSPADFCQICDLHDAMTLGEREDDIPAISPKWKTPANDERYALTK